MQRTMTFDGTLLVAVVGLFASAGVAWLLTGLTRRYAVRRRILDIPNERSLHDHPKPRAGGLAIVLTVFLGVAGLWAIGLLSPRVAVALFGGGLAVAVVGWIDDRRDVSRGIRAAVHLSAGAWAAAWLGGMPAVQVGTGSVPLGPAGYMIAALGIAWLINLYNFMDGIDGLAGGEGVTAGLFGAVLLWLAGAPALAAVALLVAGACIGFLPWNWMPARIFMGDVGSGFLGFVFGTLAVASERAGAVPLLAWLILLGVFVFDATTTLFRRMLRGEAWYREHRSHAYQRAVQSGLTHAQVTTAALCTNALLAVLAWTGSTRPELLPLALLVATAVLLVLYGTVERRRPMGRTAISLGKGANR
jgi:Fuc2NAc and GlcNAc transferase